LHDGHDDGAFDRRTNDRGELAEDSALLFSA
jgi:hypothetical protein